MSIKFLVYFLMVNSINVLSLPINKNQCITKANGLGNCAKPSKCKALLANNIKIEMCNKCKTRGLICCPTFSSLDNKQGPKKIIPAIINGVLVEKNQYPFMVALGINSNYSDTVDWKCGGSILSKNFILTAAHCINITNIMVGTNNLVEVKPSHTISKSEFDFIPHELYDQVPGKQGPNDIAIIKLKTNLTFNENVNSINLGLNNDTLPDSATVIGFGSTETYGTMSSKILTQIELHREPCTFFNTTSEICYGYKNTQKKGTCQGDSGGPLFVKNKTNGQYVQIGIVSYSFYACSLVPTVFTSIPKFSDWISLQINNITTTT